MRGARSHAFGLTRACLGAILLVTLAACAGDAPAAESAPSPVVSSEPAATGAPAPAALIPNLTQDAVLVLYLDQVFDCSVVPATRPTWIRHRCTKTASGALASVDFEGPGTGVVNLKASTIGMPETIAQGILGDTASLPFSGSNSDQALQWVTDSIGKGGATTVIAGVRLQLLYSPPLASVTLKSAS